MKIIKEKKQLGFTLVEMMVAITIFVLIAGAVSGVFISGIRAQRYALASQQLLNETSYVLEYMSRALRMAKRDENGGSCTGGCTYQIDGSCNTQMGENLKFINHIEEDDCQKFYLADFDGDNKKELIQGKNESSLSPSQLPLTSSKIEIENLKFFVTGNDPNDNLQPKVTILLKAKIENGPTLTLQTTVSQRNLDVPGTTGLGSGPQ